MEITYFTDVLFDMINESDIFNVTDIKVSDKSHSLQVFVPDGSVFRLTCQQEQASQNSVIPLFPIQS